MSGRIDAAACDLAGGGVWLKAAWPTKSSVSVCILLLLLVWALHNISLHYVTSCIS